MIKYSLISGPISIASVRAHGVQRLLVQASAKAIGPAIIQGHCRLIFSRLTKFLARASTAADALSAVGDGLIFDPTTATSRRYAKA
jgi:hypothetical protein